MTKYKILKNQVKQVIIEKAGEYEVELVGNEARVEILGAFHLKSNQKKKVFLKIIHKAKHTKANTIIKAVVEGSGEIEIQGKIIVEKGAQQTESFLQERVLLVSDQARAVAIPDLEIMADEVKCSHAATVGSIDNEQMHYLMSRGMNKKEAAKMIIDGFLEEVWGKIENHK